MEKCDSTRAQISKAGGNEKITLQNIYRKLRNLVNNKIRAETVKRNNERVSQAQDENEM